MQIQGLASQNRLTRYLRECYEELKKVTWPSRDQTIKSTYAVIGLSLAVAIFIGIVDFFFTWIFQLAI